MKILTSWLRSYLPVLDVDDAQLAEDLTLRGIAVEGVFELNDRAGDSDAALFDMDITTNRVDAMNHYGIAREAAVIYNVPLHGLDTRLPKRAAAANPFPVRIEADAEALCGRFTAQVIRGVKIGPSEGRVEHYFGELGQKLISNAVDATNFVLFGMGHPTHAFDMDKIEGGIVVRRARRGEQLKLLDGSTRTLVTEDLVVADEHRALGLAGVMGGYDSMITAETKNVLVEAAWFSPETVRASSRRHQIHTDASHRFERGADFAAAPVANALVTKEILRVCGGQLVGDLVDVVVPGHAEMTRARPAIVLTITEVRRLLGATVAAEGITAELVERYLKALGCGLRRLNVGRYEVSLPSWRLDLAREIDLIEEIARVYGYNRFANTLPTPGIVVAHPTARAEAAVRARLLALGFSEAISSTFASETECGIFASEVTAVGLENPLNEEAAKLRSSLLPGMVRMLGHNLNRDVLTVRLFEGGAVFGASGWAVNERQSLALGLMGEAAMRPYNEDDAPFFELKGVIESVLGLFETTGMQFTKDASASFEVGRAASVEVAGTVLGEFGQLSATEAGRRKLRQTIYLAELNLTEILKLPLRRTVAKELSRFQAVERDFSFTFPDSVLWKQIAGAIAGLGIDELQRIKAVEVWRDRRRFPGVYSTLIRAAFQSLERTLTDAELTGWWASIIQALQDLGGTIRS